MGNVQNCGSYINISSSQTYISYFFIVCGISTKSYIQSRCFRFLHNCHQRGAEQYTLLTQDIVDMAIQVVLAMLFLHSQRICHKDLATRNCV
jgi:serine/threonine protein kinase